MSKVFNMVGGGGGATASIFVTGLSETDTVTATNGSKTLTGKWTTKDSVSGWLFDKIKDYGTWTVTATDGECTATQDVLVDVITEYEIEMYYKLWLYRDGDECEDITGGWSFSGWENTCGNTCTAGEKYDSYLSIGNASCAVLGTQKAVDFSNYSKLKIIGNVTATTDSNALTLIYNSVKGKSDWNGWGVLKVTGNNVVNELDISNVNTSKYIGMLNACGKNVANAKAYKIWLE